MALFRSRAKIAAREAEVERREGILRSQTQKLLEDRALLKKQEDALVQRGKAIEPRERELDRRVGEIARIRETLQKDRHELENLLAEVGQRESDIAKSQRSLVGKERRVQKAREALAGEKDEWKNHKAKLNDEIRVGIISAVSRLAKNPEFSYLKYPIFKDLEEYDFTDNPRLYKALCEKMTFEDWSNYCAVVIGSSGQPYNVSLESCTCEDYKRNQRPCKHMYRLAIQYGILNCVDVTQATEALKALWVKYLEIQSEKKKLSTAVAKSKKAQKDADASARNAAEIQREVETAVANVIRDASLHAPWLAAQLADVQQLSDMRVAASLRNRRPNADKAAAAVSKIAKEKRAWIQQAKALEYRLSFYESIAPWLSELTDGTPAEIFEANMLTVSDISDEYVVLQKWLSPADYNNLPTAEKYQLAIDRWRHRRRSAWEVGRDFERYVGYCYELLGYRVTFFGAISGVCDLGRDLIAKNGDHVEIIQCKRWAGTRTIHEKHVFQLFGSVVAYEAENPGSKPTGILVTTCPLSDVANWYAKRLSIEVMDNYPTEEFDTYPLIKCNKSRSGEKIYHLPFDQQYDKVVIDFEDGEFYALTVQEAEDAGFRRAFRWHSNSGENGV